MKETTIKRMCLCGIMAAVICVLSPFSIPIGPVPVAFANLAIFLSVYLLGWKLGTVSVLAYLLLGLVGVPVFAGFRSSAALVGPTGGYLVGYIPMAILAGIIIERTRSRWLHGLGLVLGTAVCYAFGTAWYCIQAGVDVITALGACVIPFILVDAVKIVIVIAVGSLLRKRLQGAGLLVGQV